CLVAVVCLVLPACLFTEHGTGGGGDDDCLEVPTTGAPIAQALQRNPESLTCEGFGGPFPCDPACGPCPADAEPPAVSWGFCGSPCETLVETSCEADVGCRVVKDA